MAALVSGQATADLRGRARSRRTLVHLAAFAAILGLSVWSWTATTMDLARLGRGLPRLADFFLRMIPPEISVADIIFVSAVETIQIALLGTVISAVLSFGLGVLAAANIMPAFVHLPVKWLLAAIRAVPLIILALIFVSAVGLGPLPGVLTIAVHSTGMLGKFYAEAFESAHPAPLEALDSAGASWLLKLRYGVLTESAPALIRDTLFRFELNLRESLVLGLVGAGGIGFYIQLYARSFQYDKVATLTLVVLAMVLAVEQLNILLRSLVR